MFISLILMALVILLSSLFPALHPQAQAENPEHACGDGPFIKAAIIDGVRELGVSPKTGLVWVGLLNDTAEGTLLVRHTPQLYEICRQGNTFPKHVINKIYFTVNDQGQEVVYAAEDHDLEGGVWQITHNTLRQFTKADGLPGNSVYTITQGPDGLIRAGGYYGVATFYPAEGIWKQEPEDSPTQLYQKFFTHALLSNGVAWYFGGRVGFGVASEQKVTWYLQPTNPPDSTEKIVNIRELTFLSPDYLLIAGDGFFGQFSGGEVTSIESAPSRKLVDVQVSPDDSRVCIASYTDDGGVWCSDSLMASWTQIYKGSALAIAFGANNKLIIGTKTGVHEYD